MAIGFRAAAGLAAAADTTSPFANQNYTLPTGHASGDLLLTLAGVKWSTAGAFSASQTAPTGYSVVNWDSNGTTTTGNGTGSVWAQIAQKTHSGTESAPAQTFSTGYSPAMLGMIALSKASGSVWNLDSAYAADTDTTSTTFVADGGGVNGSGNSLTMDAGDWIAALVVHRDDTITHTTPVLRIGGSNGTSITITERLATNTTNTGNDGAMYLYTGTTASTLTGTPYFSVTTPTGASDGVAIFVRIREEAPPIGSVESWGFLSIN